MEALQQNDNDSMKLLRQCSDWIANCKLRTVHRSAIDSPTSANSFVWGKKACHQGRHGENEGSAKSVLYRINPSGLIEPNATDTLDNLLSST